MMFCGMMGYDMVWCDLLWCGAMMYGIIDRIKALLT